MDQYVIFFMPYVAIGIIAMVSAFGSDDFPEWLAKLCVFNATMVNGVWAAGVTMVGLSIAGVHLGVSALAGLPVAYVVGNFLVKKR